MKNFVKFFIFFPVIFSFTSCLDLDDESDPWYYFYDEPAIVESLGDNVIVRTAYGKFCVPSLGSNDLQINDILWSSFIVEKKDENKVQIDGDQYYKTSGFRFVKTDSAKVKIPADKSEFESYLADDYTEKIDLAVLYKTYVDSLLFFGFEHLSSSDYEYELFLNPQIESENGHPTLYIRAKLKSQQRTDQDRTVFAFDMTDFLNYYKKIFPQKDAVQFNLKYCVENQDGKTFYREFLSNPLSWRIK